MDYRKEGDILVDSKLLQNCYNDYIVKQAQYTSMLNYYNGDTDAKKNYKPIEDRSNLFTSNNFVQKFVQEEANYVCANKITYSSYSNNNTVLDVIRNNFKTWDEGHNKELMKQALIYMEAYELYYINDTGFNSLICTPLDSYILMDDYGSVELFIRFFNKKFDDTHTLYADVYTFNTIEHYTCTGETFTQIENPDEHSFGKVPVGVCKIGNIKESIYSKIKGLQDSYETNLSDNVNMNSDFRQAYLLFKGCRINTEVDETGESDATRMKKMGIINADKDGDVKWLERGECNYSNTLNIIADNIYQQANHINWNTKLQSNTSSLALKNQMIGLNQKVSDNVQAITDCIKARLRFLFQYLYISSGVVLDWKDVDIKITVNVPSDDMLSAQIVSQLKGILPIQEGLKLFSFIDNPEQVYKELQAENKASSIGEDLLNNANKSNNVNTGGVINGED